MHKVIILGFPLLFLFVVGAWQQDRWIKGKVEAIIDGDTIVVDKKIIRLAGIDAPEKDQLSFEGKKIGQWSTDILKKIIENKAVSVHLLRKGFYGRWIGEVFFQQESINRYMVVSGMAISLLPKWYPAQLRAKIRREGIFSTSGFIAPRDYRAKKKGHPKMARILNN